MFTHEAPYGIGGSDESTLRDRLAIERTMLANERTLLAYMRTGLALGVVGGSMIQFLDSLPMCVSGCLLVAVGVLVIAAGSSKFLRVRRRLKSLDQRKPTAPAGGRSDSCRKTTVPS